MRKTVREDLSSERRRRRRRFCEKMAAISFSEEVKVSIAPARLLAALTDSENVLPKIVPDFIESIVVVEAGEGGVGTVKLVTFSPAVTWLKSVKTKVNELDKENFIFKYTVLVDDDSKHKPAVYSYKLTAKDDGGSNVTVAGDLETVGGYELTEQEVKFFGKEGFVGTLLGIEGYLKANPEAYATA